MKLGNMGDWIWFGRSKATRPCGRQLGICTNNETDLRFFRERFDMLLCSLEIRERREASRIKRIEEVLDERNEMIKKLREELANKK